MGKFQGDDAESLANEEVKLVNSLIEPFVKGKWEAGQAAVVSTTDRGVVITLQDASMILVRLYRRGEEIPDARLL